MTLFNAALQAQTPIIDVKRQFTGIHTLEIESAWLEVSYEGVAGQETLEAHAFLKGNFQDVDIVFVEVEGVLKVAYRQKSGRTTVINSRDQGFIRMKGPEKLEMRLTSGSGKVQVSGISGKAFQAEIGSGNFRAEKIHVQTLELVGRSGNLELSDTRGDLSGKVSSGSLRLNRHTGDADLQASSGNLRGTEINGVLELSLSSGSANFSNVDKLQAAKVSSGLMTFSDTGLLPSTTLSSSSGNIRIQTNDDLRAYRYDLKAGSGRIRIGDLYSGSSIRVSPQEEGEAFISATVSSGLIQVVN
ncbi:DUF4097 family beta strand repeat-containing protein [Nitritalea halalkaliphila]|nr:DUF4097 family beta strand repeat-containing protein [Nitritalea halalkaliphila]